MLDSRFPPSSHPIRDGFCSLYLLVKEQTVLEAPQLLTVTTVTERAVGFVLPGEAGEASVVMEAYRIVKLSLGRPSGSESR